MQQVEDLTIRAQLRQRQGRTTEAIALYEKALEMRISLHGPDSTSVHKACDTLSDVLNGAALKHLQNDEHDEALELLRKAEILTGPDDLVTAVTYNNLACYYRRKSKLRTALGYLEKALRIEKKAHVVINPAGTRLNLCAVLSQLGRHHEALEHAQAAVILLQEELVQHQMTTDGDGLAYTAAASELTPEVLNKLAVLAISYHNIGVEQEYLARPSASLDAYAKGVEIARCYLRPENVICKTLEKSYEAASKHIKLSEAKKKPHQQDNTHQTHANNSHTSTNGTSTKSASRLLSAGSVSDRSGGLGGLYESMKIHHAHAHSGQQQQLQHSRAQSAGSTRSAHATPTWSQSTPNSKPSSRTQSASLRASPAAYLSSAQRRPQSGTHAKSNGQSASGTGSAARRPASAFAALESSSRTVLENSSRVGGGWGRANGSQSVHTQGDRGRADVMSRGGGLVNGKERLLVDENGDSKRGPLTPKRGPITPGRERQDASSAQVRPVRATAVRQQDVIDGKERAWGGEREETEDDSWEGEEGSDRGGWRGDEGDSGEGEGGGNRGNRHDWGREEGEEEGEDGEMWGEEEEEEEDEEDDDR